MVTASPSLAALVVAAGVAPARLMAQRIRVEVPSRRAVVRQVIRRRHEARARLHRVRAPRQGPKEADPVAKGTAAAGEAMAAVELAVAMAVKVVVPVGMAADGAAATEPLSRRQAV